MAKFRTIDEVVELVAAAMDVPYMAFAIYTPKQIVEDLLESGYELSRSDTFLIRKLCRYHHSYPAYEC